MIIKFYKLGDGTTLTVLILTVLMRTKASKFIFICFLLSFRSIKGVSLQKKTAKRSQEMYKSKFSVIMNDSPVIGFHMNRSIKGFLIFNVR